MRTRAYAAPSASEPLSPTWIERRELGPLDVSIEIAFCGICHSDLHQARDEWGRALFPMVPGHEIVGRVSRVGERVTKVKAGDLVGVGCMVDSCRSCWPCQQGLEQFCEKGMAATYNGTEMDKKTPTYGGYSRTIVITEHFVLRVPKNLDLAAVAPLLCAGITTYSPLRRFHCKPGTRVGVVGLGGLGHMAVKLAAAMGGEVTMLSTSESKAADAARLGAAHFALTRDKATFKRLASSFDILIDTLSVEHDYDTHLKLLRPHGTMVVVGLPPKPVPVRAGILIQNNRSLSGSAIGGIAETQEMLDFCGEHGIVSDVEVIPIQKVNEAYERLARADVRYRFVIDLASLNDV